MNDVYEKPCAVVVGLCAHGLTVARALNQAGISVIAVEANLSLPGASTNCAKIYTVNDINGAGLISALLALARDHDFQARPAVLFLTNDKMVETIGMHAAEVAPFYRLSWSESSQALLPLLRKDHIESQCRKTGLNYPRTCLISDFDLLEQRLQGMRYPLIVKPTKPISAFKTLLAGSINELHTAKAQITESLPVIIQEYVPGDDTSICFGALYLDAGKIVARFEGRKLRSRPMGHTTIAVSNASDEIHQLAVKFFDGLSLSGPVSLELKQNTDGTQWVIEPTVGRTDFWVGLCVANDLNLPVIEYQSQTGMLTNNLEEQKQSDRYVWVNGERDPLAIGWIVFNKPRVLMWRRIRGVYASYADLGPFLKSFSRFVFALPSRFVRKIIKVLLGQNKRAQASGR